MTFVNDINVNNWIYLYYFVDQWLKCVRQMSFIFDSACQIFLMGGC